MIYTIKNEFLTVGIESRGAELKSIRTADGTPYLWEGDDTYWSGSAPNLFPFVARLPEKSYYMDGKLWHMDIHGFTKSTELEVTARSEGEITFAYHESEETLTQYPRKFTYSVTYKLSGAVLKVLYTVSNDDEREMIFGFGAHPGFNVPLDKDLEFTDYYIEYPEATAPVRVSFDESSLLRNGLDTEYPLEDARIRLRHDLFDDDAVVLYGAGRVARLASDKGSRSVTLRCPGMDYIGLWHAVKTDAPYVCIEPWTTLPGIDGHIPVFEEEPGLVHLAPGRIYENKLEIEIG